MRTSLRTPQARRGSAGRSLPAAVVLLFGSGAILGCAGTDFDPPTEVKDLRILAMRLDPPEVELPLDEGADPIPVEVTALIASSEGEPVLWQLSVCGSLGAMGCGVEDSQQGRDAAAVSSGRSDPVPAGEAPQAIVEAEHHFTFSELLAMLETITSQGFAGTRPVFELIAVSGDENETAAKRLQVSLPDIAYRLLLAEAGLVICDERGLPEDCLDYRTRHPNENPDIEAISFRRASLEGDEAPLQPFPDVGPLIVAPGETVHLVPTAIGGSAEEFQTLAIDIENRTVRIEDRTEMLIWTWFSTAGEFSRHRTEEERTRGDLNVFTAPAQAPESGGDLWIWVVLRDTRGGADFTGLHLRVEP